MSINDALLPEFDREMGATRRVLERVPDAHLEWSPHERSMSLGQLATHIGELPAWAPRILEQSVFELGPDEIRRPAAPSCAAVLESFDRHAGAARAALAARTDAEYLDRWTLRREGRNVFTLPKAAVIRTMVMNHMVHHRGQLTVYLRLLGVPLPPLYGPSADEAT
jgi:uncharacterized damage-inducible protein DinB